MPPGNGVGETLVIGSVRQQSGSGMTPLPGNL